MAVKYICRHCQSSLGEIHQTQLSEMQLGFHLLTSEERKDIISYNSDGNVTVQMVCDYCMEALNHHPELHLIVSPLQ